LAGLRGDLLPGRRGGSPECESCRSSTRRQRAAGPGARSGAGLAGIVSAGFEPVESLLYPAQVFA
jgi:hypothetical protein